METRMQRYAKYRSEIKTMSAEEIARARSSGNSQGNVDDLDRVRRPDQAIPVKKEGSIPMEENPSSGKGNSPYRQYLSKRKALLIAKIVVTIAVVAVFAVWLIILLGRA